MNFQKIPLELVSPSPMNPRKTFDDEALAELAANIEKQGLIQPVTVRLRPAEDVLDETTGEIVSVPNGYEIVCGERRFRAFSLLKAKEDELNIERALAHRKKYDCFQSIPAIVREMTDEEAFEAMITENLQRQDVDPMEEAFAFGQLIKNGKTPEEVALKFGKSLRFVQDRVKLNSLIPELMVAIKDDKMSLAAAMIICKLNEEQQKKFFSQYSGSYQGLTKSSAESFVNGLFMTLSKAPWYSSDNQADEEFDGGCGRKCSECNLNTANHGCLFWEMKAQDGGRCTNREKFNSKILAYMLKTVDDYADELIRKDKPLEFGKIVIALDPNEYCAESAKAVRLAFANEVERRGYEIANLVQVFSGKCWYESGDERLDEKKARGEVYRVLTTSGYDVPNLVESHYYVRGNDKSVNSDENGMPLKVNQLLREYDSEKNGLKSAFTIEQCKTLSEHGKLKDHPPLNATELNLICLLMLNFDATAKKELGVGQYPTHEELEKIVSKPESLPIIMRSWLKWMLATGGMTVSASIDRARLIAEPYLEELGKLWCPEKFQECNDKVQSKYDKKIAKIEKALKSFGYDLEGNKIETPTAEEPKKTGKLRRKYAELKEKHPESIVLFKTRQEYVAIDKDAGVVNEAAHIACGIRRLDGEEEYSCGFAHSYIDTYLPKLIRAGKRVCICDDYTK